jgi:hypothetical protein
VFKILDTNLSSKLELNIPINWSKDQFFSCQLTQFDREGYELLPIEQEYYKAAGFNLHKEDVLAHESGQGDQGWQAICNNWVVQTQQHPNIFLDHSLVVHRLGFGGEALEQIKHYSEYRPELAKLIHTKTKWGHDFCLDWIDEDGVTEIIHWEWDFRNFEEYDKHRQYVEKLITDTNWITHSKHILDKFKGVHNMISEQIGDLKAKELGLSKAFRLFKTL